MVPSFMTKPPNTRETLTKEPREDRRCDFPIKLSAEEEACDNINPWGAPRCPCRELGEDRVVGPIRKIPH